MKRFRELFEAAPRNLPLQKTDPTETQKKLTKRDVGKAAAVKFASGKKTFRAGADKIADVQGEFEKNIEQGKQDLQRAKDFDASTTLNPDSGRVVVNPEVKKLKKLNPTDSPDELARKAAEKAEAEAEAERQQILKMPRGPERSSLLGDHMRKRMRFSRRAGNPGAGEMDVVRNKAVDKEMAAGEGGKAVKPTSIASGSDSVEIYSQSGLRHNFAPAIDRGYDTPEKTEFPDPSKKTKYTHPEDGRKYHHVRGKWTPEISPDDVQNLVANLADPTQSVSLTRDKKGETVSKVKQQNTELGNNPQVFEPSAAELDYFKNNPEGIKLLKALDDSDAKTVSDITKTHYVGEIGQKHDSIDEFLDRADIRTDLSRRGLDAGKKLEAVYGGVMDDDMKDIASKYQVKGAPEGVYNTKQIEKDGGKKGSKWTDKNLEKLYNKIFENRLYEVTRTYLEQGGVDGYARFEGHRSIEQMNLEHIAALNADDPNGKGFDHPSNWAWASEPLNKVKNKYKLGDQLKKFDQPRIETPASGGASYRSFRKQAAELSGEKESTIKKQLDLEVPALSMSREKYQELSQDEIEKQRENMLKFADRIGLKITQKDLKSSLPDRKAKPGFESDGFDAFDASRREREAERMELDTDLAQVRSLTNTPSLSDAADTPLGKKVTYTRQALKKGIDKKTEPTVDDINDFTDFG